MYLFTCGQTSVWHKHFTLPLPLAMSFLPCSGGGEDANIRTHEASVNGGAHKKLRENDVSGQVRRFQVRRILGLSSPTATSAFPITCHSHCPTFVFFQFWSYYTNYIGNFLALFPTQEILPYSGITSSMKLIMTSFTAR